MKINPLPFNETQYEILKLLMKGHSPKEIIAMGYDLHRVNSMAGYFKKGRYEGTFRGRNADGRRLLYAPQ